MAVTRRAPWWLPWELVGALVLLFVGERVVGHLPTARLVLSSLGALGVVAHLAWRLASWQASSGDDRRVERILLLGAGGVTLALALYALAGGPAASWIDGAVGDAKTRERVHDALSVLWPILLVVSFLPTAMAGWAAGVIRRGGRVEAYRVVENAANGLTIACAAAALALFVWIAGERDTKVDVSYFRTSAPGSATQNVTSSLEAPLQVLLFFPEVNEVKNEAIGYFGDLAARTGRVELRTHDRLLEPALAKEHAVAADGTVVLVHGKQSERITLGTTLSTARSSLRILDQSVHKALMRLARGPRVAYLTVGHGELNDADPEHKETDGVPAGATIVRELLALLNYRVNDLGVKQGLATDIPNDAAVLIALGPRKAFLDEELAAIDRYLERGGSLFLALDPTSEFRLGPLAKRLGVRYDTTPLADEKAHVAPRRNPSDRAFIMTDQFSAHASVTSLSRARVGYAIVLATAGSLADDPEVKGDGAPKRTYVVRSMPTTFADKNGNFTADAEEQKATRNLVAAVEGPSPARAEKAEPKGAPKPPAPKGMRAMVVADATLFADPMVANLVLNRQLFADAVKWLGGEEKLAGETISEKDVAIEHTKTQDVAWFYSTIVGAPLLVLGGGLLSVWRRRRRAGRRAS